MQKYFVLVLPHHAYLFSLLRRQSWDRARLERLMNAEEILYHLTGTALRRITNMARQLMTGQQCGWRCAPKWDKIELDSKSLAVAPGLRAPVAVTLLSCIRDEALYWQWAEDVFEVMNSGIQTHNISGHILSRLVYSQGLLCWIKQIHLLSPEAKPVCFLHIECEHSLHLFRVKHFVCCKFCREMQLRRCDTWNDSSVTLYAHFAVWNTHLILNHNPFL